MAVYHWNEPFASLVKATELSFGGREAKISEPLRFIIDWLMENPDIAWRTELREAAQTRVPELHVL